MAEEKVVFRVEIAEGGLTAADQSKRRGEAYTQAQQPISAAGRLEQSRTRAQDSIDDASRQKSLSIKERQQLLALGLPLPGDAIDAKVAAQERRRLRPPPMGRGNPFVVPPPLPHEVPGAGGGTNKAAANAARAFGSSSAAHSAARLGLGSAAASAASATVWAANPAIAAAVVVGLGTAAAVTAPAIAALGLAAKAATAAFKEIEQLGQFNIDIARAQALRTVREIRGQIRRADQIGPEAASFITARSQLQQAILDAGNDILKEVFPVMSDLASAAAAIVEAIRPLIPVISDMTGKGIEGLIETFINMLAGYGVTGFALAQFARLLQDALEALLEDSRRARESQDRVDQMELDRALNFFNPDLFMRNIPVGTEGI